MRCLKCAKDFRECKPFIAAREYHEIRAGWITVNVLDLIHALRAERGRWRDTEQATSSERDDGYCKARTQSALSK